MQVKKIGLMEFHSGELDEIMEELLSVPVFSQIVPEALTNKKSQSFVLMLICPNSGPPERMRT